MTTLAKRLLPPLWALLTVGIVVGVVWAGLRQVGPPPAADVPLPSPATGPTPLREGHDYYFLVKLIEFNPLKPNGSHWDVGSGSAPDAKVLIRWHGQQVFALPQREDQFISTWDVFRVNVMEIIRSGGNVDVASSINGPIVRIEPGETIDIEVRDADLFSDDEAMNLRVPLADLHEGANDLTPPRGSGVRRCVVQVIDREVSMSELVAIAGKR